MSSRLPLACDCTEHLTWKSGKSVLAITSITPQACIAASPCSRCPSASRTVLRAHGAFLAGPRTSGVAKARRHGVLGVRVDLAVHELDAVVGDDTARRPD